MKNKYEIRGEVTALFVMRRGRRFEVLIDTEDLAKVQKWPGTWTLSGPIEQPYARAQKSIGPRGNVRYLTTYLHRMLLNAPSDKIVDHINHDTLDNRKENLRLVDRSGNAQNMARPPANNTSGFRGVHWHQATKKWQAKVHVRGREHVIGFFSDKKEAARAVARARAILMPYSPEARKKEILVC